MKFPFHTPQGAWQGLGIQPGYKSPNDLWVEVVKKKTQWLISDEWGCPLNKGPNLVLEQPSSSVKNDKIQNIRVCTKYKKKENTVFSSFLLAFYEYIHLGPNPSLSDLLNVQKDESVFSFRQVVPHKKTWSGFVPDVKRSAWINDWEIIAYWEEPEQSEALANKFGLFQKQLGIWGGGSGAIPKKLCKFYPHLRLEMVFPALELSQNYHINMSVVSSLHQLYLAWKTILTQ